MAFCRANLGGTGRGFGARLIGPLWGAEHRDCRANLGGTRVWIDNGYDQVFGGTADSLILRSTARGLDLGATPPGSSRRSSRPLIGASAGSTEIAKPISMARFQGNLGATPPQFSTVAMIGNGNDPLLYERVRYEAYGRAAHRWPGDFDDNGSVNSTDQGMLTTVLTASKADRSLGATMYDVAMDLNRDGVIDSADQSIYSTYWSGRAALGAGFISDPAGPDNIFGFDGYVFSAETQLYCVRFRWYEPLAGRWLERDPAEYVDGLNQFCFNQVNPVNLLDPLGLEGQDAHMYPLFLGGCDEQVLVHLDDDAHSASHACINNALGNGKWEQKRSKWSALSPRQRKALVIRSARAAGVENDVIRTHIDSWMRGDKDAGKNNTHLRDTTPSKKRRIINPDGTEYIKLKPRCSKGPGAGFAVSAALLLLDGYFTARNVEAALERGEPCRMYMEYAAAAATGFDSTCRPFDCDRLSDMSVTEERDRCKAALVDRLGERGALSSLWLEKGHDKLIEKCQESKCKSSAKPR